MHSFNLSFAFVSFIVLCLTFFYKRLKNSVFSETIIAMLCGVLLGPQVLGIIDMKSWGKEAEIMNIACRLTLAMALMATAFRIPVTYIRQNKQIGATLLLLVMPAMFLTSGSIIHWVTGLPWLLSLLIGAVITPTDPVLAGSIVTGSKARQILPERVRNTISFESGANDGLAFPFVMLCVLLMQKSEGAWQAWLLTAVLQKTLGAVAAGMLLGYIAGKTLNKCLEKKWTGKPAVLAFTLSVAFFVLTAGELLGVNSILAVFIAGLIMNKTVSRREDFKEKEIQDMMERLFIIPIFIFFGLLLPWHEWIALGWKAVLLVVLIFLLRRPPYLFLFKPLLKGFAVKDLLFMGWFGPIGVAAIFYAFFNLKEVNQTEIWIMSSLVIFCSVIIHGMTAYPLLKQYGGQNEHDA